MATHVTQTEGEETIHEGVGHEDHAAVAQLTHELNNQLSTLANAIYLMRSEPLSAASRDLLDAAEGAVIRLAHLSKKIEEQSK